MASLHRIRRDSFPDFIITTHQRFFHLLDCLDELLTFLDLTLQGLVLFDLIRQIRQLPHLFLTARMNPWIGDAVLAAAAGHSPFRHLIEKCHHGIVILLTQWVVFVVVALRAGQSQSQPVRGGDIDTIKQNDVALFLGDRATLAIEHVTAVKARRDFLR